MSQSALLCVFMLLLAWVNVSAFRYLGLFGFLVTAASIPFANRILDVIFKMG